MTASEDSLQWLVSIAVPFASTFAGVFLAFALATKRERKKREKEQSETKRKIKEILVRELTKVRENLDGAVNLKAKYGNDYIPNVDLPVDAKESIVNSGTFSLLELELQAEVSHVYLVIERAEIFLSQMREFKISPAIAMTSRDKIFSNIAQNFWGQVQHLQSYIPTVLQKLRKKD